MMYRYLRKIRSEWLQLIISLVLKPYIVFSGCRTQTPDRIRIIFLFRCRQEFFQNVILARWKELCSFNSTHVHQVNFVKRV
jgi:hypothetical protein